MRRTLSAVSCAVGALAAVLSLGLLTAAGPAEPEIIEANADEAINYFDPSSVPIEQAFDFYIGEWDYAFDNGNGRVRVTKKHDRVIAGELTGQVGEQTFTGSSMAAYAADIGAWRQVWTDTFGFFLFIDCRVEKGAFIGEWEMNTQQGPREFRHVFSHITRDSFTTDLYVRDGEGEWQNIRHAVYTRVLDLR